MDNTMMATISLLNTLLGFISGIAFAKVLYFSERAKLQKTLDDAIDDKFETDLLVDELREELENERTEKAELVNELNSLVNRFSYLPPPDERPLKRSRVCTESDSEDEEIKLPTSPKLD